MDTWRIVLLFFGFLYLTGASFQSVKVEGVLVCEGKPYRGALIKLYDHDTFTPDDKLGETESGPDGTFSVEGTGNEITTLNAKFNIYHRCKKHLPICYYKATFKIPSNFVTSGTHAGKPFNAGTIELSMLPKNRDCIN